MEQDSSSHVKVAVHIRPLVTPELLLGCTDCITTYPAEKQVQIGSHAFTFDYVFGSKGHPSSRIFDECVAPLVEALFHGYNGTVLAYGQTGSGKTYTMGTNYNGEDQKDGVIPKVIDTIFSKVEATKESTEFLIRVSFIEIFKEEVFDLLDPHPLPRNDSAVKPTGLARAPIQIRETVSGGITLAGVTDAEVRTKEEMASYLFQGSLSRATGSTNMNSQSSRSHAIFTISVEQRRITHSSSGDDVGDDILIAKLHLVDLAGSERAKRTGADGMRLQEGIHINKGLLSLGNVISALGDEKKRKEGGHVPYRDSKLTRILQDSLGGNSKTIMIACVSPADTNAEETLNTLKYANRARNIQNKAIVNRDPVTAQMQRMRSQIEQLQAELLYYRGDSNAPAEELKILKHKISLLEQSKVELQEELQACRTGYEHLTQRSIEAQVERDRLLLKMESIQNGKPFDEIDGSEKDLDIMKGYITKIQDLETELLRLRNSNSARRDIYANAFVPEDDGIHSTDSYLVDSDICSVGKVDEAEDVEKELEHSSLQEKFDKELKELEKTLELKQAEMKRFAGGDNPTVKQHYEKKVHELEQEKMVLQKEIEELRQNLACIANQSGDSAQKVKEEYLQKLNVLEKQVAELKKKQDAQAQMLRQKQKSDEAAKRLQDEIHRIKTQKVQLQQKIKQESEQFRQWKASREKEVLQLKKEGRRNEYEMHKLLSLNQRQKQVLQRKTEEAAAATKRLKELLDSRKSREAIGSVSTKGPGIQALVQAIEHELEVTVRVHEVRSEYERQMEERSKMASEVAKLKEEALIAKQNSSEFPQMMSPGARSSRIYALENMLATTSSALVSMASHLSEAEERERAFSGRGRWNQVRTLPEAKNIMNYLFNLASSSRCQLRDREVDCREMDSEIRELKEKIVNLVTKIESQEAEIVRRENAMKLAMERQSNEMNDGSRTFLNITERSRYDLRPKGFRNSMVFDSHEDMDLSQDEKDENLSLDGDDDGDWGVGVCCSCSKYSLCKTSRCECRAANGSCSFSCSCEITKCSNRNAAIGNDLLQPELTEAVESRVKMEESKGPNDLASHAAELIQTAFSGKPNSTNNDSVTRKPLSDIGNTTSARSAAAVDAKGRKKWRKPEIQLVPAVEPPIQTDDVPVQPKSNGNSETSAVPPKVPRPKRSVLPNNNQLKDKNSDQRSELVNKEGLPPSLDSANEQGKTVQGKENREL